MNYIASNLMPILAATIMGLVIGIVYGSLTGHPSTGPSGGAVQRTGLVLIASLAEFWLASILAGALILAPATEAGAWTMAIGSAVVIWIGFIVPVLIVSYLFRHVPLSRLLFDCLHWVAVMVAQAAVLHLIGLVHP